MYGKLEQTLVKSLTRHIHSSKREVTVMFTDIEDSTRYWGNRGNINGRLMVDRHNRILLPLVRQFRGKVVKTIGDSIMATFTSEKNAAYCAIAMQQALQQARDKDKQFKIRVRIGLHIGEGVVEENDVFGDVVNIAARVEGEAEGNEILLSGRLARRLDKKQFIRHKKGSFIPKGKNKPMAVYQCDWSSHDDLVTGLNLNPALPLGPHQTMEMIGYCVLTIVALYYLNHHYIRYLISDNEGMALLFLNPAAMLLKYWYLVLVVATVVVVMMWWLMKIDKIPHNVLSIIKASAAAGVLFMALHAMSSWLPVNVIPGFMTELYHSQHLFVEVISDEAEIYQHPDDTSEILRKEPSGELLLLTDIHKTGDTTWNKVLLGEDSFGWVKRIQPARIGVVEERVTLAHQFKLKYGDVYLILLTLPVFIWGFRSFRVRPM